jgi:hypothetical protein
LCGVLGVLPLVAPIREEFLRYVCERFQLRGLDPSGC